MGGRRADGRQNAVMNGVRDMEKPRIEFSARILRKRTDLPRYIVIKPEDLLGAKQAFEALISLNGTPQFKGNIRPWGKGSDVFFFNIPSSQCQKARLETGDHCLVTITPV
ncbi:hypothetical protein [Sphingomicrobium astaxanthinifaciens]|uniref:hypothetical protein n=1 Tax=Sphingomicrobium astaxanthinifaciens TaxID=1227949 RepID=UPI001FCCAB0E|nr:hypothetical protein [Sphingomicrobium astaxanthinifaciens]MCJ7420527.1 hypothetical protein [Sphingomicrobium astaxanthinifaciens]